MARWGQGGVVCFLCCSEVISETALRLLFLCLLSLLYNVTRLGSFAKIYFSFSLECLSISFFLFFFFHSPKNGFQTWKGKE